MRSEHDWVEIALDYRCNLQCLGCRANHDTGERLDGRAVLDVLSEARARNVPGLWIGGGEPTLRSDLLSIVATARKIGFSRVLLQTNGVRLAYPAYADAVVRAGVTDISFNVKSDVEEVHDRLSRSPGSHALLTKALENVRNRGPNLAADILLTKSSLPRLARTVEHFAALGIRTFTLWLLSASDIDDPNVHAEVPDLRDLREPFRAAAASARSRGVELVSLHTPPCTLPSEDRDRYLPARALRLIVVDPSGRSFPLESSPFEGGSYVGVCDGCRSRATCGGPRADYLALHGTAALEPL